MIIKSVSLQNFRNYKNLSLVLGSDTNIFFGDNAQGKTNILEAVYLSGTTRSHRGSKDREMILLTEEEAHICTILEKEGIDHKIDIHLRRNRTKGIAIDGIPIRKASELFGLIYFVVFSPEDLSIIKNGPAERRKFMDTELCQLDKVYLYHLSSYNKAVIQRNKLLKELYFRPDYREILEILDMQLVKYGKEIICRRRAFSGELNEMIHDIHLRLSGGEENMLLTYECSVREDDFEESLKKNRDRDIHTKTTTVGPHRDDLSFQVNGLDIRRFGSQGQQRTTALSLKLSEIELVKQRVHDTPVLLLDDVMSELDEKRQKYLLESIDQVQTLITCTGLDEMIGRCLTVNRIYRVSNGNVTLENGREA
ncbi:MAG: DNA replication/repair protein RecF [Lachnospiraceae bacterium]|nr:DNA replication/repair protein RecF [Lachnospiraceae bacterium]